ncbi:hypothetical protein [Phyllobacterium chamaecytisi]|uniref:hypothetical protein n=1 Tax=Phyllobacterium chamaecytisi TaxID=2876082 RepID=UPI004028F579
MLSKLEVPGIEVVRFDDESTNMTAFASAEEGMTMICVTHEMGLPARWPTTLCLWITAPNR